MKKIWKRMAAFVSVLCLALGCAAFAACGETTFTVKVVDPDGNPIEGALVAFCSPDGIEFCLNPIPTDKNGVVSESVSGDYLKDHVLDSYLVKVVSAPGGTYERTEGAYCRNTEDKYVTSDWGGNSFTYQLVAATAE